MTSLIISIVTVVFVVATLIIGTVWIESKRTDKTVREVKRPAKVGEYIKLTSSGGFSFSQAGDILKVDRVESNGIVYVLGEHHPRETYGVSTPWVYILGEYVVLKNYTPGR